MFTSNGLTYVTNTKVKLEGKYIGNIKEVDGGYAYFPKGQKEHGNVYTSPEIVKVTL